MRYYTCLYKCIPIHNIDEFMMSIEYIQNLSFELRHTSIARCSTSLNGADHFRIFHGMRGKLAHISREGKLPLGENTMMGYTYKTILNDRSAYVVVLGYSDGVWGYWLHSTLKNSLNDKVPLLSLSPAISFSHSCVEDSEYNIVICTEFRYANMQV